MNFRSQKSTRDCFPTCFSNAMTCFAVPVVPVLSERLSRFDNGTENCTIHASEERLEHYERSIHKFIAEWNWAYGHKNELSTVSPAAAGWAVHLLEAGIRLEFRNGPLEQRRKITEALAEGKIIISEIWNPPETLPDSEQKHFVLIVKSVADELFIHDPLPENHHVTGDMIKYGTHECCSNVRISCDYFFGNEAGPMKPKPNRYQTDWGYRFLVISRQGTVPATEG